MQPVTPAAQYLRMSTDHQQYSLDNQADAIAQYAAQHQFQVVKTYSDSAKSGLRLKNRAGLKQLLKDVVEGQLQFRAVLVYDVSRWGRFQDTDEAAHYEYLCKSSGVMVHYCAEMFTNDNSVSGLILKAVKRTMAGEYSRELSVKVKAGLVRLASLGYKLGGSAPYGLRRQLLDFQGQTKQLLAYGQRKSIVNERVILVPGPPEEVAVVHQIFGYFADEHHSPNWIAKRLNEDEIPYLRGAKWKAGTIRTILQDPHYIGMQVWGRTTAYLSGPVKHLSADKWIMRANAFEAIVPTELFLRAQQMFASYTGRLTNEELLERLRHVYEARGELTGEIIDKSRLCPGLSTYYKRFGGLLGIYARLGYDAPQRHIQVTRRQRILLLRKSLMQSFVDGFPGKIEIMQQPSGRFRPLLRHRPTGLLISVVVARCVTNKAGISWQMGAPMSRRGRTTVLALLDKSNTSIQSMHVLDNLRKSHHVRVRETTEWLKAGEFLTHPSELLTTVQRARQKARTNGSRCESS